MTMASNKRFTFLEFPKEYPRSPIADNEVLLVFNEDEDAVLWRQWWDQKGAELFQKWLNALS